MKATTIASDDRHRGGDPRRAGVRLREQQGAKIGRHGGAAYPRVGGRRRARARCCSTPWGRCSRFADPAPLLRAALRERLGVDVGADAAARAIRAEIAFYRAHLHDGPRRGLAGRPAAPRARRRCARQLGPAAGAPADTLTEALLAALRFDAFPDAAPALRALRARGPAARRRVELGRLAARSGWPRPGSPPLVDGVVASAPSRRARSPTRRSSAAASSSPARDADAAWHVGDSEREDVAGARAAGIAPVLLRRGDGPAPDGVTAIRSLAELSVLLRRGEYPAR